MIVATTQYPLEQLPSLQTVIDKMDNFSQQAKNMGAQILLLPEYAGLEWCWIHKAPFFEQVCWFYENAFSQYLETFQHLAGHYGLYIQPGTVFSKDGDFFYNRAYFFSSDGKIGFQDKIHLTVSEKNEGWIAPGKTLSYFETSFGKIAIAVCYDVEFPELQYYHLKNNVSLLLVPSYTDTMHGFNRVQLSCRARAHEHQIYVAQACAAGLVNCSFLDEKACGQAGIFGPLSGDFPNDGILQKSNHEKIILETLCLKRLNHAQDEGDVRLHQDRMVQLLPDYKIWNF